MPHTDDELLHLVRQERKNSIGFGEGDSGELTDAREKALAYYKGEMKDVVSLPNRSRAVDTTVADAIETVLPDVIEVFVGGEDVATFLPLNQADEAQAQEETAFVQHVVSVENEGFLLLYSAFKDAMLTRTGIMHWWWEETETEELVIETAEEPVAAIALVENPEANVQRQDDGTISITNRRLHGKVKVKAFPSEDFSVARDTVSLRDTTYCAVRDRPRVQALIARGIDAAKARALKPYNQGNDTIEQTRDEAGEHDMQAGDGVGDLRAVEIRDHYLRLDVRGDGKLSILRITTDAEETVLLDKEEIDQIPFAALTPYIVPHRFYGESIADKLIQVQQIKTALLRMLLDSGYFALNQRNAVDMSQANDFTIPDLLRNEPGVPVRTKGPNAITPIAAGSLGFDALTALEYAATMAESRSGVVRNAQGLNPDTLHDTAKGAMALVAAAQKRVRMIARIFAETGVKDLYMGVHCMLRRGYRTEGKAYEEPSFQRGKAWTSVKPAKFPERCAMTVHVGVGSAGRDHDLIVSTRRLDLMERLVGQQGGVDGPFVDADNIHNALMAWERASGTKAPDAYWSDPRTAPPQEPKPDPEQARAQAELALEQEKAKGTLALKAQEGQQKAMLDEAQGAREHELAIARMDREFELKRYQVDQELALRREQVAAELDLKREIGLANAAFSQMVPGEQASVATSPVEPGGDPG